MAGVLLYESNNSGGHWWLEDRDWKALEKAGWTVHWLVKAKSKGGYPTHKSNRYEHDKWLEDLPGERTEWLGAKACSAAKRFSSKREGVEEFERASGASATDMGCPCCGCPHRFQWLEDGAEHTEYIAPEYGPATLSI